MSDMILDINRLPEALFARITTAKVKIHEEGGSFIVTPVSESEKSFDGLAGMFSDGKLSIDSFLAQKQLDKANER